MTKCYVLVLMIYVVTHEMQKETVIDKVPHYHVSDISLDLNTRIPRGCTITQMMVAVSDEITAKILEFQVGIEPRASVMPVAWSELQLYCCQATITYISHPRVHSKPLHSFLNTTLAVVMTTFIQES